MAMNFALSAGFTGLRASLALLGTVADEVGGSGTWNYDVIADEVQAAQEALAPQAAVRSGPEVQPGKKADDARTPAIVPAPQVSLAPTDSLNPGGNTDLADSLTTMMMARRAFEANGHVIATANRVLGELISLTA